MCMMLQNWNKWCILRMLLGLTVHINYVCKTVFSNYYWYLWFYRKSVNQAIYDQVISERNFFHLVTCPHLECDFPREMFLNFIYVASHLESDSKLPNPKRNELNILGSEFIYENDILELYRIPIYRQS